MALPVDPSCARSANLVSITEVYAYENGERAGKTGELAYNVCLPFGGYTNVRIKVKSLEPLLPLEAEIAPETKVVFEGLKITPYVSKGQLAYSGTASSIRLDKGNAPIPTAK